MPLDTLGTHSAISRDENDLYDEYRRRVKMAPLTKEQKRRLGVH